MQKTTHYNLNKPDVTDFYNIEDFNENADAIDSALKEIAGTALTAELTAGETSIVFSGDSITTSSTFDFYTDKYGVNPTAVIVEDGSLNLTFDPQDVQISVKVVVR